MINDVVEHLSEAIVPDAQDVLGQLAEQRRDVASPNRVLCQTHRQVILLLPLQQWRKLVPLAPCGATDYNGALSNEPLHVFVHGLPGAIELLRRQADNVGGMRVNMLNKKFSYWRTTGSDRAHILSTSIRSIVNFESHFVNLTDASMEGLIVRRENVMGLRATATNWFVLNSFRRWVNTGAADTSTTWKRTLDSHAHTF